MVPHPSRTGAWRPLARRSIALCAVLALSACGGGSGSEPTHATAQSQAASRAAKSPVGSTTLIVVLRAGDADALSARYAAAGGGRVDHVYRNALRGFSLTVPDAAVDALLQALERDPAVNWVEPDQVVTRQVEVLTQASPPSWGLDRIDQSMLPLDRGYRYSGDGSGVRAYVVDTGIDPTHPQFGGRVVGGATAIGDTPDDCNGHGTHVAGTIGSASYGVAKAVTLVPVRVLGCDGSGTTSGVISGLDWVALNGQKPGVVNMSLGGGASSAMDAAVARVVAAGFPVAVAAGNSNVDACRSSPAREPSAITVGATTSSDVRAGFSNFGSCLDLFAPGDSIVSTWPGSRIATASGTSMASPHVAGVAALMLWATPGASPSDVAQRLAGTASTGVVGSAGRGSPNRLLQADYQDAYQPPVPVQQTVTVGSLTGAATTAKTGWRANVTVTVKDTSTQQLVSGAVVTGGFTVGGSGLSCTTGSNGGCTITSGLISKTTASVDYTVSGIGSGNLAASLNYDGQGTTQVTVLRP